MNMVSTTSDSSATRSDWAWALTVLAIVLLVILAVYRETALSMVEIWARSETFTHGFLVPPIALWLIWRIRDNVALAAIRPSPWFLIVPVGAGFVWLLGEFAAVGVVSQFALVTMLVFAVPTVLGWQLARRIVFPLTFLYFAVPFGEFAMPFFMEWTAKVTVIGLRASGIPVYREGLQFVIPSGNWSVVEACSGIRYLIASVTVGTLFAYLSYTSLKRRALFVAVSFVVPIIANWVRAYMIVMLGHLSGNKLAAGVDHLIYGWVFFGIVIMAMFWIGSRWREDESRLSSGDHVGASGQGAGNPTSRVVLSAFAFVIVTLIWPFAEWNAGRNPPPDVTRIEALASVPGWTATEQPFVDWTPHFENPSATLRTSFMSPDGRQVGLYIAYYRNQDYQRKMVSSSHRLVAGADTQWSTIANGDRGIEWAGKQMQVKTAELGAVDLRRLRVWRVYWVDGHVTASDAQAKVYTAWSRLVGRGDDSAAILLFAAEQANSAATVLDQFASATSPMVMDALDRTRRQR